MCDIGHGLMKMFPTGEGGVDGGNPASLQAVENSIAIPVAYVQGVDNDGLFVDRAALRVHGFIRC